MTQEPPVERKPRETRSKKRGESPAGLSLGRVVY